MKIGGIVPFSLCDYPGHVCAVVFTQGCNFCCPYCHNKGLIPMQSDGEILPEEDILRFLQDRSSALGGVVISGGEPTLQRRLPEFAAAVRGMGFHVKLDTNGSRPHVIRRLIRDGLLDFIAMDIKAPLHMYGSLSSKPLRISAIQESIVTIARSGLPHEFRTTLMPGFLSEGDMKEVIALVPPGSPHRFQPFRDPAEFERKNVAHGAEPEACQGGDLV